MDAEWKKKFPVFIGFRDCVSYVMPNRCGLNCICFFGVYWLFAYDLGLVFFIYYYYGFYQCNNVD